MEKIYLDNAATTFLADEVKSEIESKFDLFGNPSSRYSLGKEVRIEIENARDKIANFIGAKSDEVVFTSGATESNNFAIKGVALANPNKKQIIVSAIEHPSILETCNAMKKLGYKIDIIPVDKEGIIKIDELNKKTSKDTLLVSVMHVNNEIGTIQPIEEIAKICKAKKVLFHVDAVQSFAKIPINVNSIGVDLLSVSGHKINAMKGIGFLYIKKGTKIIPLLHGGGQEEGMRSGTENVLGIISLAKAIGLKRNELEVRNCRDRIIHEILKIPGARLSGSQSKRVYNNACFSFYGIEGESLQMLLDEEGIYVSTGSACSSNKLAGSHVLKAIGVNNYYLNGSIRVSLDSLNVLSRETEKFIIQKIKENVEKLSKISPFKFSTQGVSPAGRKEKK